MTLPQLKSPEIKGTPLADAGDSVCPHPYCHWHQQTGDGWPSLNSPYNSFHHTPTGRPVNVGPASKKEATRFSLSWENGQGNFRNILKLPLPLPLLTTLVDLCNNYSSKRQSFPSVLPYFPPLPWYPLNVWKFKISALGILFGSYLL